MEGADYVARSWPTSLPARPHGSVGVFGCYCSVLSQNISEKEHRCFKGEEPRLILCLMLEELSIATTPAYCYGQESPARSSREVLPALSTARELRIEQQALSLRSLCFRAAQSSWWKLQPLCSHSPGFPRWPLGMMCRRTTDTRSSDPPEQAAKPTVEASHAKSSVLTSLNHSSLGNPTAYGSIFPSFISEIRNVQFLERPHAHRTRSGQTVAMSTVVTPSFSRPRQPWSLCASEPGCFLPVADYCCRNHVSCWGLQRKLPAPFKLKACSKNRNKRKKSLKYHFISTETFKGGIKELVVL